MPLDWISWFVGAEINMNVYNAAESVHLPKEQEEIVWVSFIDYGAILVGDKSSVGRFLGIKQ